MLLIFSFGFFTARPRADAAPHLAAIHIFMLAHTLIAAFYARLLSVELLRCRRMPGSSRLSRQYHKRALKYKRAAYWRVGIRHTPTLRLRHLIDALHPRRRTEEHSRPLSQRHHRHGRSHPPHAEEGTRQAKTCRLQKEYRK